MAKRTCKELISIAIYQLMYKIPFNDITVKMICEKAGVSRMTFYRYYNTKEDIFIDYSDERFAEFYELYMENKDITIDSFTKNIIHYFKQYERQIKSLEKSGLMYILITLFERYASYLMNHVKSLEQFKYRENPLSIPYFAGGLYNVLFYWSKHNFKPSEEEMASMLEELIGAKIPLY